MSHLLLASACGTLPCRIICSLCCSEVDAEGMVQEQFVQSAWKSSAGILVRLREANGPPPDGFALVLTVCVCVCVVAALGAGQLHQPREQRGDREDVAGGTVSFPLSRGNFILALL